MLGPGRGLRGGSADDAVRRPDCAGWQVQAELTIKQYPCIIKTEFAETGGRRRRAYLDSAPISRARLVESLRVSWLTPSMDRIWNDPATERRRLIDRMTALFFSSHAPASSRYERAMRERNLLLREGGRDTVWLESLELRMAEYGSVVSGNRSRAMDRIRAEADGARHMCSGCEFAILRAQDGGESSNARRRSHDAPDDVWSEPQLRDALRGGRQRDLTAGRTLQGPHRSDLAAWLPSSGTPLRGASTGEQKWVLMGLMLACARALSREPVPSVLLLDEVAAHLDASRREALFDEISGVKAQVWLSGTCRELFETIKSGAAWFEILKTGRESRVIRQR